MLVLVTSIIFQEGQILSQIVGGALSFCATLYLIRACGRLTPLMRGGLFKKLIIKKKKFCRERDSIMYNRFQRES